MYNIHKARETMEKDIKRYRIIDYEEFKRNYKGNYDNYIVKESKKDTLYKLSELNIKELINKRKIEFIEKTIENEGKYIEYVFEGEINFTKTRIILSIPTKILIEDEYENQQEQIIKYLKELKETIKIQKEKNAKQNIEMLKYIRNIIIASGISVGILFTVRNKQEEKQNKEPKERPKVVYETPNHDERDYKDIIRRIRL